jgi:zinc protease
MSLPIAGLTPARLEAQRGVVIQEYRQRVGNRPYGRGFEFVQKLLYPTEHPYHWPPAGLPDCVNSVSRGDVEAYFRTNFTPDRAVLVLVGNFSPDEAVAEVERHFSALSQGACQANGHSRPHGDLPPLNGTRRRKVGDHVNLPRVHLAYRAPGFGETNWYAAALLFRSLAVGRTSPLQQRLVCKTGIAQEVKAQMVTMRDASTAAFVATAAPGVEQRALEEALITAVDELLNCGVSNAVLGRARNKALTDHFSMIQRSDRRAEFIASSTIFCDDPARVAVEDEYYRRITSADLSEFVAISCRNENRVVLSLVPQGDV